MSQLPSDAAPGWYEDPNQNGRDRWWTGEQWSKRIATQPKRFASYARSMRAGENSAAAIARVLMLVEVLAFVVVGVIGSINHGVVTPQAVIPSVIGLGVLASAGVLALVFGIIGLVRAGRTGGRALAIWTIAFGALGVLLIAVPLIRAMTS